ncbi:MAG: 4-hydroxy-3-methylbut-2-enyl diphosphate reductase, partial [Candidatus Omnitrophica bacterium]|nr:4-hydroxy-3-methylbut-2-enyl diphosphate reductase [Candidatus Omnitrophota bacterium]
KSWFTGKERIGIASGASTPDWIIEEVVKFLKRL